MEFADGDHSIAKLVHRVECFTELSRWQSKLIVNFLSAASMFSSLSFRRMIGVDECIAELLNADVAVVIFIVVTSEGDKILLAELLIHERPLPTFKEALNCS